MKYKSAFKVILFYIMTMVIPLTIILCCYRLIDTKQWFENPMGYCVNTIMITSLWAVVVFELYLTKQDNNEREELKIVDCMTIILTVITICYSFLQICNPPIVFGNVIKLIVWFSAIIAYAIWIKPTKMKVLSLCLVAVVISTLFVLPATYQGYYENKIIDYKIADDYSGEEYSYIVSEGKFSTETATQSTTDGKEMFEKLMEDEYFTANYSDTLCRVVQSYINSGEEIANINENISIETPMDYDMSYTPGYVVIGQPLEIEFEIKSDAEIEKIRMLKTLENGFSAGRTVETDGNIVKIKYDKLRGFSGVKNTVFLKGFACDANENESPEISAGVFVFYGYDILVLIGVLVVMLIVAGRILKKRYQIGKNKDIDIRF